MNAVTLGLIQHRVVYSVTDTSWKLRNAYTYVYNDVYIDRAQKNEWPNNRSYTLIRGVVSTRDGAPWRHPRYGHLDRATEGNYSYQFGLTGVERIVRTDNERRFHRRWSRARAEGRSSNIDYTVRATSMPVWIPDSRRSACIREHLFVWNERALKIMLTQIASRKRYENSNGGKVTSKYSWSLKFTISLKMDDLNDRHIDIPIFKPMNWKISLKLKIALLTIK